MKLERERERERDDLPVGTSICSVTQNLADVFLWMFHSRKVLVSVRRCTHITDFRLLVFLQAEKEPRCLKISRDNS